MSMVQQLLRLAVSFSLALGLGGTLFSAAEPEIEAIKKLRFEAYRNPAATSQKADKILKDLSLAPRGAAYYFAYAFASREALARLHLEDREKVAKEAEEDGFPEAAFEILEIQIQDLINDAKAQEAIRLSQRCIEIAEKLGQRNLTASNHRLS